MRSIRNTVWRTASRSTLLAGAACVGVLGAATDTTAQEVGPLEPRGIAAGGFLIYPSLTVEERYDSNIFATPNNEEGDFITSVRPEISVESQWSNHELNFRAGANGEYYADNTDENTIGYFVGTDGRLDITRDTNLFGGLNYTRDQEARGSADDVGGEEPTDFDVYNATLGGFHRFNRLSFRLTGTADRFDYDDVPAPGGGTIDNDNRDRDQYQVTLRGAYQVHPDFSAFVEGSYNVREYDESTNAGGVNRDSSGYGVSVGSEIDLTGITTGSVSVGYREQNPDASQLDTTSGVSASASLSSDVTPLTTLGLAVETTVDETTQTGASGAFSRSVTFTADHELLRTVLLDATLGYANKDYEGIDRMDNVFTGGAGVEYLANRYMNFRAGYEFTGRRSDVNAVEYDKHVFLLSGTLQY